MHIMQAAIATVRYKYIYTPFLLYVGIVFDIHKIPKIVNSILSQDFPKNSTDDFARNNTVITRNSAQSS
jgi:hypothetical protein